MTKNKIKTTTLPAIMNKPVTAQSGYRFIPCENRWVLDRNVTILLNFLDYIDVENANFIRCVLCDRAREYKSYTVRTEVEAFRHLFKNLTQISVGNFLQWLETLKSSITFEKATLIRKLVLFGVERGYPGISDDLVTLLRELPLKTKRKVTLKTVETFDITYGPFSDIEFQNVLAKSLIAFEKGTISLKQYVLLMLFAQTGRRGIQIAELRLKDLKELRTKQDTPIYLLNVPRAKQRNQHFRELFNTTVVDHDLWLTLNLYKKQVIKTLVSRIGPVPEAVLIELPFFYKKSRLNWLKSVEQLIEYSKSDALHMTAYELQAEFMDISRKLNVISERTGEKLSITPKRFRHTLGTNMAREGYGVSVIAENLDHSTNVVAGTYVNNSPEIVKRLDAALAMQLAPLAQAFTGVIITSENEATRGKDPSSRVSNGNANLGSCGSYGFCSALAPVACYTCSHFQPWLDAPHQSVLTLLLEERQRIIEATGDEKIAAVNDRLILAVNEVVQKCDVIINTSEVP